MDHVILYGGPFDGRIESLKDEYIVEGKMQKREGWPLIIELRAFSGEQPADTAAPVGKEPTEGRRLARYRLAGRKEKGFEVYEYVPD